MVNLTMRFGKDFELSVSAPLTVVLAAIAALLKYWS
jgi:hypothetical protein